MSKKAPRTKRAARFENSCWRCESFEEAEQRAGLTGLAVPKFSAWFRHGSILQESARVVLCLEVIMLRRLPDGGFLCRVHFGPEALREFCFAEPRGFAAWQLALAFA